MGFVKLDDGILTSTLWRNPDATRMFIAALCLARSREFLEPVKELAIGELKETGFSLPPGQYGFVAASGPGLADMARIEEETAKRALQMLAEPDPDSRSADFDGRRLIRVNGGFVVLNYLRYREHDYSGAERARRYRARNGSNRDVTRDNRDASRYVTQAEAEAEADPDTKPPIVPLNAKPEAGEEMDQDLPLLPEQVGFAVRDRLRFFGREITLIIDDIAKREIKAGKEPQALIEEMVKAWEDYTQAIQSQKLEFSTGPHKFFGTGMWQNRGIWRWKEPGDGHLSTPKYEDALERARADRRVEKDRSHG